MSRLLAGVVSLAIACSGAAREPDHAPTVVNSLTGAPLFCAFGGVGEVPDPLPPRYETEFASTVVAIDNDGPPIPGFSLASAILTDASNTTLASLRRVDHFVVLPTIEPESPTMGSFAVHLNPPGAPFDGTLPSGRTILRVRVSLDHAPTAYPEHCKLTFSAGARTLVITGGIDGSWPT